MALRDLIDAAIGDPQAMAAIVRHLGGGSLATTGDGDVWRLHGRDAVVARLDQPTGRSITIRVPVAPDGDPSALDVHAAFATAPVIARLRAGVPSHICGGVSVIAGALPLRDGRRQYEPHPIIAMEWIPGPSLADAAFSLAERGDQKRLTDLATQWTRAMLTLGEAEFSHGELDPGNALLRRGDAIVLVDYDTAAWHGSPAGRFPIPDPAYTHPGGVHPDPLRRDDLPALIVLLTLRALAADPRLLTLRDEREPQFGLLLTPRDLAMPADSRRFHRMAASPDPEVAALAGILADTLRRAPAETPRFVEVVRAVRVSLRRDRVAGAPTPEPIPTPPTAPATSPRPTTPPSPLVEPSGLAVVPPPTAAPRKIDPRTRQAWLTRLNSLLLDGNDEEAVRFWRQSGLADDDTARKVAGKLIDAAAERLMPRTKSVPAPTPPEPVAPAQPTPRPGWSAPSPGGIVARLENALAAGDIDAIETLWARVQPTADSSRLAAAVHETLRQRYLAAMYREARQGDLQGLRRIAENAVRAGVPIPADLRPPLRLAIQQEELIARLEAAIAGGNSEEIAAIAWSDPEAVLGDLTPEARSLLAGARRLPSIIKAIATDNDRAILAAAGNEQDSGAISLPPPIWQRLELARTRVEWADAMLVTLGQRDDAGIDTLLREMPDGADRLLGAGQQKRIARWRAGHLAQQQLAAAIAEGDERAFIAALDHLERAGATLPADLDRAGFAWMMARVGRAMDARDLIASGRASPGELAASLPALLADAAADPRGLAASLPLDEQRTIARRGAHVARLREALATAERSRIRAAAIPDPDHAVEALEPEEQALVAAALADRERLPIGPVFADDNVGDPLLAWAGIDDVSAFDVTTSAPDSENVDFGEANDGDTGDASEDNPDRSVEPTSPDGAGAPDAEADDAAR